MTPNDTDDALPFSPAAERNKAPILQALLRRLPATASVLEIAAGTGQHAQHFAQACPGWRWQPTDASAEGPPAIDARCRGLANVLPAIRLDVLRTPWPLGAAATPTRYDAVYCANLLHISSWATCPALMKGAARHLVPGGCLLLYGPYRVQGVATAPSNEAFDADLQSHDPAWGLRDLSAVEREATAVGMALQEVTAMPANNLLVVFAKP
jgi:SAM-dependent methyltransferase